MLLLAVATSIDALAVGITLALLPGVNIAKRRCCSSKHHLHPLPPWSLKVGGVFGLKYKEQGGDGGRLPSRSS
ncbi:MAG: manganese efflux pump [Dysosmobacter sp.]